MTTPSKPDLAPSVPANQDACSCAGECGDPHNFCGAPHLKSVCREIAAPWHWRRPEDIPAREAAKYTGAIFIVLNAAGLCARCAGLLKTRTKTKPALRNKPRMKASADTLAMFEGLDKGKK